MINQAIGASLAALNRVAQSPTLDRLGLRKPATDLAHEVTKHGFATIERVGRSFQPLLKLARPARLPAAERDDRWKRFDLTLTDEQEMMRETLQRFADEMIRPAAEAADTACIPPKELLAAVQELGIALMAIPEELGGFGQERSPISQMLIVEDLARGDMGLAYAVLAPLAFVNALVDFGTAEQQSRYLAPFAGEDFVPAALALVEPHPRFDPHHLRTRATSGPDGFTLYGEKSMVALGEACDVFLVAAELLGGGPQLFLVEASAEGVTVERQPAMGLRSAGTCRLRLDGVKVPNAALLGQRETDFDYGRIVDLARIGWAAMTCGAGQAVLDYVIPYVNDRQAFGEPISNRQAVAFMVADIAVELEGMRLLTYRAASRAEQGKSFQREAFLAQLQAAEKGMKIGTDGVQLLGGAGFIKDHPVERWYRDLRAAGVMEGGLLV